MSYVIKNNAKRLILKLTSTFNDDLYLGFKVNNSSVEPYLATHTGNEFTWDITLKNWNIGDVITDIKVYSTADGVKLYEMNEGIDFILDDDTIINRHDYQLLVPEYSEQGGEEIVEMVGITYDNVGEHTIQAVYKGNKNYMTAKTPKTTFFVKQSDSEGGGIPSNFYRLEFLDLADDTFKYKEDKRVSVKLTKGGEVMSGKQIIMTSTGGYTVQGMTDGTGVARLSLNNLQGLQVGTHNLNATYYEDNVIQCSAQRKINIIKNDPIISFGNDNGSSTFNKNDYVVIRWQEPDGDSMYEQVFPVYVNGALYNCLTNVNGRAWIRVTNTGTYNFKILYWGNQNMNAKEVNHTITVN